MKKASIIATVVLLSGHLISFESHAMPCYAEYNAMNAALDASAANPANPALGSVAGNASVAYIQCMRRSHVWKE